MYNFLKIRTFTSCTYYREAEHGNLSNIPIAVISASSDHSRIAAFTCINTIINELKKRIKNSLKRVILRSDGCSSQFCSKYMLELMTHFDKSGQLEWHYNKAHHGKIFMNNVGGTIKRMVFGLVKSNNITINIAEELATEASTAVPSFQSNYLFQESEIIEPSFVKVAPYVQENLNIYYVKHPFNSNGACFFRIL